MSIFDDLFEMTPRQVGVFIIALVVMVWAMTYVEVRKMQKTRLPVTSCIDGGLYQAGDTEWYPVYIKGTKRIVPCQEASQ